MGANFCGERISVNWLEYVCVLWEIKSMRCNRYRGLEI